MASDYLTSELSILILFDSQQPSHEAGFLLLMQMSRIGQRNCTLNMPLIIKEVQNKQQNEQQKSTL